MDKNNQPPPLPNLPLQLMLSMGTWLASPFALASASAALPHSKKNQNPAELLEAVANEAQNRANDMLAGINRYLQTPYKRSIAEPPCIWKYGSARLLDYGQVNPGPVVLFVPSLINRYYILDLEAERSFLRFLAKQGFHPLVLDWGEPGKKEEKFDIEDYVSQVLLPAIDFLHKSSGKKIALAGYCMGGVLSLAATQLGGKKISSLSLFATPWDFHCKQFLPFVGGAPWQSAISRMIGKQKFLPAEMVQSLFYMTDPWVFENKFRRFFALDSASRAAKDFIALEHWVNDGIPMTARVARDCLLGWAQNNQLATGSWQLANKIVNPAKIKIPTFIAIPKNDHVVPFDCAWPLAQIMKHATILQPSSGHVGMMIGGRAKKELWQPFADWLRCIAP